MLVTQDVRAPFPCYFLRSRDKTTQRKGIAQFGASWCTAQHCRGIEGRVMIDIDDTLINSRESARCDGFQDMLQLYKDINPFFIIHIVTARPDYDKEGCLCMLHKRGFAVDPDRLHMLPGHLYDHSKHIDHDVTQFKWDCFRKLRAMPGMVVARFGDKLWDVAHPDSIPRDLVHICDRDCIVFLDPRLGGTLSAKLPGQSE